MDKVHRTALVERYRQGYDAVVAALDGITDAELDVREARGEWSPREVVHHLADSEMTSAIRLRRLVAEEQPRITGYDQEAFARLLHYDRPVEPSLAAFRGARESTSRPARCPLGARVGPRGHAQRERHVFRTRLAGDLRRPRARPRRPDPPREGLSGQVSTGDAAAGPPRTARRRRATRPRSRPAAPAAPPGCAAPGSRRGCR